MCGQMDVIWSMVYMAKYSVIVAIFLGKQLLGTDQ